MMSLLPTLRASRPADAAALENLAAPAPHRIPPAALALAIPLGALDQIMGDAADNLLPDELRACAKRRRLPFLGGRLCAELALERMGHGACAVGRAADGSPRWPAGIVGSITHTDEVAYAVVAPQARVGALGIDSEAWVDAETAQSVAEVCCTAGERAAWFPRQADPRVATVLFSAKEALYKAIHPRARRYVDFTEVEAEQICWHSGKVKLRAEPSGPLAGQLRGVTARFEEFGGELHTTVACSPSESPFAD
jgi:enterobactin synthetase component D